MCWVGVLRGGGGVGLRVCGVRVCCVAVCRLPRADWAREAVARRVPLLAGGGRWCVPVRWEGPARLVQGWCERSSPAACWSGAGCAGTAIQTGARGRRLPHAGSARDAAGIGNWPGVRVAACRVPRAACRVSRVACRVPVRCRGVSAARQPGAAATGARSRAGVRGCRVPGRCRERRVPRAGPVPDAVGIRCRPVRETAAVCRAGPPKAPRADPVCTRPTAASVPPLPPQAAEANPCPSAQDLVRCPCPFGPSPGPLGPRPGPNRRICGGSCAIVRGAGRVRRGGPRGGRRRCRRARRGWWRWPGRGV
ncbi:hypothetical protein RKD23_006671 [Streptomyces sp. SAI-170]